MSTLQRTLSRSPSSPRRQLRALRDPDRFESWLYRLLVRTCYNEAKRARHHRVAIVQIWPEVASTRDDTLTVQHRDRLERGFRRLSPEQRAVLCFITTSA